VCNDEPDDYESEVDYALRLYPPPTWKRYAAKEIKAAIARLAKTDSRSSAARIKPECLINVVQSMYRLRGRMKWFLKDTEIERKVSRTRKRNPEWFKDREGTVRPAPRVWRADDWPPVKFDVKAILTWRKSNGWN
jgi:hypothetical protein